VKPVPLIVNEKLKDPAGAEVGEIEVIVGAALDNGKVMKLDSPPPGVGLST